MRTASTAMAFVFGLLVVGLLRMGVQGAQLGFVGGAILGLIQFGLIFGFPYLVWRGMGPKKELDPPPGRQ